MKIINYLLNIHKFVVINVVSIEIIIIVISFEIIIIVISFDSILKLSSISTKIQYIVDFLFIFVVYHY